MTIALEDLSWPQVQQALEDGTRRVVFALGATEQHGPHLPLKVDAAIGSDLCHRIAGRLGRTLVAPTVRVGCSEHHMDFPGTLTVRRETLEALATDYVTSLARHGFQEILIIPSHGGNFGPLAEMLPRLRAAAEDASSAGKATVWAFLDLAGLVAAWKKAIEGVGGAWENVGGHADIAESSIMQTLTPELVSEERAEAGHQAETDQATFERIIADGLRSVTENGILGNAQGMSPEIGHACQQAVVQMIVEAYQQP